MANCKEYQKLSTEEKVKMIGNLIHAVQNDAVCFMTARGMINGAKARGVFDGVTILPETEKELVNENY
jgi:uncharacterized protein YdeI (BOF family)